MNRINILSFFFIFHCATAVPRVCFRTGQLGLCSTNSACDCLQMVGAAVDTGVCAFRWLDCSRLEPCQSPYNLCAQKESICLHHSQCGNTPLCYPMSMMDSRICPEISTNDMTTSPSITSTTKTTTITTPSTTDTTTYVPRACSNDTWLTNATTIIGNRGAGEALDQTQYPLNIFLNEADSIFIADSLNHRIMEWKKDAKNGSIVAGGNGRGNRTDQLNLPSSVIIDKQTNTLIICDSENRRVVQWSLLLTVPIVNILVNNIDCRGLAFDNDRNLYVSDVEKQEVRRYRLGESTGIVVAGGNGLGDQLNQFNRSNHVFVDEDQSVYVSDYYNHRVMKWSKGATKGVVVAGGRGEGSALFQLRNPNGILVDKSGAVYVADRANNRVVRWCEGASEGQIVVGGNGLGTRANQMNDPHGLSFDRHGNLFVVDYWNNRVQRFSKASN